MMWQSSAFALAQFVSAAIAFLLSLYCWSRRDDRSASYFSLLLAAVAVWCFFSGIEAMASSAAAKIVFVKLQYIGVVSIGPLWLLFALGFSRREAALARRQRLLLWAIPAITLILVATNEYHSLIWPGITPSSPEPGAFLIYTQGPAVWIHAVYAFILVASGTFFVLRTEIRSPRLYRGQGLLLILGVTVPWITSVLYLTGAGPFPHQDLTPIGFAVFGILVTVSVFRFGFLSLAPMAHEMLFAGMSDGIIAVDAEGRIVDINEAARRIAGLPKNIAGRSLDEAFAAWPHYLEPFREVAKLQTELQTGTSEDPGWVDLRITPLYSEQGRLRGRLVTLRDITAQKRAEEALLESEGRFRFLVENAPVAVFVQTEGSFAYVNPAACRLFGADSAEALLGTPVMDRFHPDFRAIVSERIRTLNIDRKEVPRIEEIYLKLDGTLVDAEVEAVPFAHEGRNGALVFVRDITERKRAESALFEQGRRFKGIFENTEDAVFLLRVEPGRRLVYEVTNPAHQRKTGLGPEDVCGKTPEEALPPDIAAHVRAKYEECLRRNEPVTYEEELDLRSGSRIWQTQLVPIPGPDGRVNLIAGFGRDITEQKRAEAAIRTSDEEKSILLKEIHHRVKNNMQVISSMLNLQAREVRDPGIIEIFRDTQTRIRSMALVHEKLYQSRDLARVDFASYLQSLIVHLFHAYRVDPDRVRYEQKTEVASLDINTAIPVGLIVSELVSNALKYAFPEGRSGHIRIGLEPAPGGRLTLRVADDGIGLPADLDVPNVESLGLQIVNMLVAQIGGKLEIDRTTGTEFRIAFPGRWSQRPS